MEESIKTELTALDILRRCKEGPDTIRELEDLIRFRRDTVERCTQQFSNTPHSGGGVYDKVGELSCEIVELQRQVDLRKREYAAEQCAVLWIVERLPTVEQRVLRGWYLEKKSLRAIAAEICYSDSSVKRFRDAGERRCAEMNMDMLVGFLPEWYERAESDRSRQNLNPFEPV